MSQGLAVDEAVDCLRCSSWQAHRLHLDVAAKVSYESEKAFLEGREMPTSFHEDLPVNGK